MIYLRHQHSTVMSKYNNTEIERTFPHNNSIQDTERDVKKIKKHKKMITRGKSKKINHNELATVEYEQVPTKRRFEPITDNQLEDYAQSDNTPGTHKQTSWAVNIFKGKVFIFFLFFYSYFLI